MQDPRFSPPEPPAVKPVRGVPVWRWIAISVFLVVLLIVAIFVPIPVVYLYLPGPVRDVEELVEVEEGQTYSSERSFYMTTVSLDTEVSFVELLIAAVTPSQRIVMRDEV